MSTASDHLPPGPSLRHHDRVIAAALAALLLALGAWRMVPGVTGVYHDDAVYVITAKALAQGDGYRLINLPDAPPQTKYPILYPLLLAGVWTIWPAFPDNVVIMQGLTLGLGAVAIALGYLYLVRFDYCGRLAAAGIGVLSATSADVTYFSTITMPEMPFAMLVVLALWRLEHANTTRSTGRQALVTGMMLALPFLCRSVGAAFMLGGLASLAARRRPVGWTALGAAIVSAPWLAWSAAGWGMFGAGAPGYYTDYAGAWRDASASLASVITGNVIWLLAGTARQAASGLATTLAGAGIHLPLATLALGLVVWATVTAAAVRGRLMPVCLLIYAAVVIAWPWPPDRFLVPVLGLVLGVAIGAARGWRHPLAAGARPRLMAGALCLTILTALNLSVLSRWTAIGHQQGYPVYSSTTPPDWRSFQDQFEWIKANTRDDDVLLAGLDTMLYLYTGRRSVRAFPHRPVDLFYSPGAAPVGAPDDLTRLAQRHRASHLVTSPMYLFSEADAFERLVRDVMAQRPPRLRHVHTSPDARWSVYAFLEAPR